jgi:hypothetical protein
MPKLRFNITMSLDGYVAGPDQSSGRLFENLDGGPSGYECVELVSSPAAAHDSDVRKDGAMTSK